MAIFQLTLRMRIYLSMLAIMALSFIVTGALAIYDDLERAQKNNALYLERKEEDVRNSLHYFLDEQGGHLSTDSIAYVFADRICELSTLHQMVITFFDLKGNYIISSNADMVDSLGIGDKVKYTILKQLSTGNQRAIIDQEAQKENQTLTYWYFNDIKQKPIAIVNAAYKIPPVDRTEVTNFLKELGKSYIILFVLASVVAYLLSRYITKSLDVVSKRMQLVELGKHNEPIEWKADDEIGVLVNRYNDMLTQLEQSADKLAQTERESAWREMAKQVAHEIKNPLTPMKLRVQHLQKSWSDGAPDFANKLNIFSQSMTEQIDTLSNIATEFSNFAKMPTSELIEINLISLTKTVLELFKENEHVNIELRTVGVNNPIVFADKNQTIRCLNNLINNAIQAIPESGKCKIDVAIRNYKKHIVIRVNDNGIGIPDDKRSSIFVPNFTTKSTGSGLGLAMVKNIIHSFGGHVWFWSQPGKGTSFYLSFPTLNTNH